MGELHSPGKGHKETEESFKAYRSYLQDDSRLGIRLADLSGAHLLCEVCGPEDPCHADEIIRAYIKEMADAPPRPRLFRIREMGRDMGFGKGYFKGLRQGLGQHEIEEKATPSTPGSYTGS